MAEVRFVDMTGARALAKWLEKAKRAAGGKLVAAAAARVGLRAYELAAEGIESARNPAGRAWAPRGGGPAAKGKRRSGFYAAALALPRALSVTFELRGTKVVLEALEPWAIVHQAGGRRRGTTWTLAARSFLPKKAVPKRWGVELAKELSVTWRQFLDS